MAIPDDIIITSQRHPRDVYRERADAIRRLLDEADAREAALLDDLRNRYGPHTEPPNDT